MDNKLDVTAYGEMESNPYPVNVSNDKSNWEPIASAATKEEGIWSDQLIDYVKTHKLRKSIDPDKAIEQIESNRNKIDSLDFGGLGRLWPEFSCLGILLMLVNEDLTMDVCEDGDIYFSFDVGSTGDIIDAYPNYTLRGIKSMYEKYRIDGLAGLLKRCKIVANKEVLEYFLSTCSDRELKEFFERFDLMDSDDGFDKTDESLESVTEDMYGFEAISRTGLEALTEALSSAIKTAGSVGVIQFLLNEDLGTDFEDQITFIKNTTDLSDSNKVLNEILQAAETLLDDVQIELLVQSLEGPEEMVEEGNPEEFEEEYQEPEDWSSVDSEPVSEEEIVEDEE